jgi:hypothetical protein
MRFVTLRSETYRFSHTDTATSSSSESRWSRCHMGNNSKNHGGLVWDSGSFSASFLAS